MTDVDDDEDGTPKEVKGYRRLDGISDQSITGILRFESTASFAGDG